MDVEGSQIANCQNNGEIRGKSFVGGIAGNCLTGTFIIETQNMGKINATDYYVGGIVGWGGYNIDSCYNIGSVTNTSSYAGGICGATLDDGNTTIENCYNIGEVTSSGKVGGITGLNRGCIINSYCLDKVATSLYGVNEGTIDTKSMLKPDVDMKLDNFVTLLNSGKMVWKKDIQNKNNGYPILIWQN